MAEEEQLKSKYNSALAQLYRLDNLWKDCNNHSRTNQFIKWNLDLDCIWKELSDWTKDNDEDTQAFKKLNKSLEAAGLFQPIQTKGFKVDDFKGMALKSSIIYGLLMDKEIFLRRLQSKQGRAGLAEDSVEDYMDEGF